MQPIERKIADTGVNPLEEAFREKFQPKPKRMKPLRRRRLRKRRTVRQR